MVSNVVSRCNFASPRPACSDNCAHQPIYPPILRWTTPSIRRLLCSVYLRKWRGLVLRVRKVACADQLSRKHRHSSPTDEAARVNLDNGQKAFFTVTFYHCQAAVKWWIVRATVCFSRHQLISHRERAANPICVFQFRRSNHQTDAAADILDCLANGAAGHQLIHHAGES
jgi:hypothetical protein